MFRYLQKRPSLEIHIPISPTAYFLNMTHYLVSSLRRFGGAYRNARVVLTIGDAEIDNNITESYSWIRRERVEVKWVSKELYARDSYFASAFERFRHEFRSDVVLMLDADILISKPFDELILECHRNQYLAGVIAHVPPFSEPDGWKKIYQAAGLGEVSCKHEHTGWGYMFSDEERRFCPPYFNFGVVCAPSKIMKRIGEEIYDLMHRVESVMETGFRGQIALSLAITKLAIPYRCLPMRYNFPNDVFLEALHGLELPHAAILHLLRDHQQIYKTRLFADRSQVETMLARKDLRGVNLMAQDVLRQIHSDVCHEQTQAHLASNG
ncbi:MAG: hypothetical protein M3539_06510 [Acidobacteriota bacterium]|nr:hypothetical protein [Acidobacteriota bacterium]